MQEQQNNEGHVLRVLTVNTHKGFAWLKRKFILHELRESLREVNPDLVFLQEVLGEHRRFANQYATQWPEQSQYEFLADEIWSSHAYGRNAVYPHGHHGNALLSRHPINHWHNHDISLNGFERRGLLYCHVQLPNTRIHTICVHLSLRESHRQKQLHQLCQLANQLPKNEPLVIAGDFNDWRQKAHNILLEKSSMIEAFRLRQGKPQKTFPAAFPMLRLDRIYLRKGSKFDTIRLSQSPWRTLSDHKPLMVELTV